MKSALYRRKGLTLIEMMIVMAIILIMVAAISRILVIGGAAWHSGDAEVQVNQEARRGMYAMARELRNTRGAAIIINVPADGNFYNTVTFKTPMTAVTNVGGETFYNPVINAQSNIVWQNSVTYSVVNNQLRRTTSGGASTVLANNVNNLTFRRQPTSVNILEITIQTRRTTPQQRVISSDLNCAVKMRN